MPQPARRHRRGAIILTAILTVATLLIGAGVYGLLRAPNAHSARSAVPPVTTRPSPTASSRPSPVASLAPVAATRSPEIFARRVAAALFAWDTSQPWEPTDYMQTLVDVGDPSGEETAGLASDLTSYYPNTTQWAQLRDYRTHQWLDIDTAVIPATWPQAVQEAHGTLRPGTTAYTVIGIRHRAGVWEGKPVTSTDRVSFTIFETCRPGFSTCRLLRLSQPDTPLR